MTEKSIKTAVEITDPVIKQAFDTCIARGFVYNPLTRERQQEFFECLRTGKEFKYIPGVEVSRLTSREKDIRRQRVAPRSGWKNERQ